LIVRSELSLPACLASLRGPLTWAAFAFDDPLAGLLEMPLTAYRVLTKRLPALRSKPRSRAALCSRPTG
jgi:predicted ATP-grasp superfamily ATP-dependent carboligase